MAGAALAGDEDLVSEARVWQRRHGGTLVTMFPFVIAAEAALDERLERMPAYLEHARALAAALATVDGVEVVPDPPQTPLFHLHLDGQREPLVARGALGRRGAEGLPLRRSGLDRLPRRHRHEVMVGEVTLALSPDEVRDLYGEILARASPS